MQKAGTPTETSERLSEDVGALRDKAEEILAELDRLEGRLEAAEVEQLALRETAGREQARAERLQAELDRVRSRGPVGATRPLAEAVRRLERPLRERDALAEAVAEADGTALGEASAWRSAWRSGRRLAKASGMRVGTVVSGTVGSGVAAGAFSGSFYGIGRGFVERRQQGGYKHGDSHHRPRRTPGRGRSSGARAACPTRVRAARRT